MWLVISKAKKMGADPVLTTGGWVCGVEKPNFCTACKLGCVCISGGGGVGGGGVRWEVVVVLKEVAVDQHVFEVTVSGVGEKRWAREKV